MGDVCSETSRGNLFCISDNIFDAYKISAYLYSIVVYHVCH